MTNRPSRDFDALLAEAEPGATADFPASPGEQTHEPVEVRLDRWWGRMLSTPARQRLWYWGGPLAVTLLAAVLRLWNLGHPRFLVFDETFYVKDAWTLIHLGYEGSWPAEADASFAAGNVNIYTTAASYVVHPPLGKWLIGLGMAAFGGDNSVGWRISTAVVGILAVFVLAMIARALFKSTVLATIAGGLLAIDGHAIVMSRVGLLDNFVMFFALLGFWAILLDKRQSAERLSLWLARRTEAGRSADWGPALWWRPWLLTAGLLFGLTSAVKWSGLYFLAAFAVYTLLVDALARRRAGIAFWASGTIFKQGPVSFLLTVPIALTVYVAGWTGWFVTNGGYYRHWADGTGNAITGAFSWIPHTLQSLWHFQVTVYNFHVNEHAPHAYAANPLTWLFMVRPTSMYYLASDYGQLGCQASSCGEAITSIANPLIWWAATAAAFYLLYRVIRFREWQLGLILTGLAAGYLPWLLYLDRTVFQFYTIAFEPYLILGLTFVVGLILGKRTDPGWRRLSGIRLVAVFLGLAVVLSVFWYPLWTAVQVPEWFLRLHYWLPSWV
ncbi:MAG: dolichyl-phosphate-mannose--protein mannosyltransferase [Lacisediminihabitans sp.]